MKFEIAKPLKLEYEELHAELVKAIKAGGNIGDAAKAVAAVLHSHLSRKKNMHYHRLNYYLFYQKVR